MVRTHFPVFKSHEKKKRREEKKKYKERSENGGKLQLHPFLFSFFFLPFSASTSEDYCRGCGEEKGEKERVREEYRI